MTTQACCPYCLKPVFDNGKQIMDFCLSCDKELAFVMHVDIDSGKMVLPEKTKPVLPS